MYKIQVSYAKDPNLEGDWSNNWRTFTAHYKRPDHAQQWVEHCIKVIESERGNLWPIRIRVNGQTIDRAEDVPFFMED